MCQERKKHKALISGTVPPYVLEVVETYCFGNGMELEVIPEKDGLTDKEYLKGHIDAQTACVYIQHPNYYGNLEDAEEIGEIVHGAGAKYVMGVNPISLGVIKTPAEYGADVAVGEGQPLGLLLGFGGPYLGFMASKEAMMRKLPGRIVGETVDHNGKTGYVLTLQAREQHIRREKDRDLVARLAGRHALQGQMPLQLLRRAFEQAFPLLCHCTSPHPSGLRPKPRQKTEFSGLSTLKFQIRTLTRPFGHGSAIRGCFFPQRCRGAHCAPVIKTCTKCRICSFPVFF